MIKKINHDFFSILLILAIVVALAIPAEVDVYGESGKADFSNHKKQLDAGAENVIATGVNIGKSVGRNAIDKYNERKAAEEEAARKAEEEAAAVANPVSSVTLAVSNPSGLAQGIGAYISTYYGIDIATATAYGQYFVDAGANYSVDPLVLVAIAERESKFTNGAVSSNGLYVGMMQTTAGWAAKLGYSGGSLYDPYVSINAGALAVHSSVARFGNYRDGISGYAYGEGSVMSGNFNYGHADSVLAVRDSIAGFITSGGYL